MRSGHSRVFLLATLPTGLITGLFCGFSVAINPALARLPDAAYIETMQAINEVIQNPWFGLPFFAPPLLLVGAAWQQYRALGPVAWPRRLAVLLYLVGNLGITLGANVPLNEELAAFQVARLGGAAGHPTAAFCPGLDRLAHGTHGG